MIEFRQKEFTEYDAMRYLYTELMKDWNWKNKLGIIDSSALIPILKGNNIVIERFVINKRFLHSDNYRMYIKIGARAKMPDEVRLPGWTQEERLGQASLNFNTGFNAPKVMQFSEQKPYNGIIAQKEFSENKKNGNNNGGGFAKTKFEPNRVDITHEVQRLLGEAVEYNKKDRSLVLEFERIEDAIRALNILPFGLNYKVYLLDV